MITRIHIQNFRSCEDVLLDNLPSVVALIGRNGAGKTNVLKAIEALSRIASRPDAMNQGDTPNAGTTFSMIAAVAGREYRYRLSFEDPSTDGRTPPSSLMAALGLVPDVYLKESLESRQDDAWTSIISRDDKVVRLNRRDEPIQIGETFPCLPAVATFLPESDPIVPTVLQLLAFLRSVRYYPLADESDSGTFFILESTYQKWLSQYKATGMPGEAVLPRLIHMYRERAEDFHELMSLLGQNGLGLIDRIVIDERPGPIGESNEYPAGRVFIPIFFPSDATGGHPDFFVYQDLSLGTRRVLRILLSLLFDKSSVMLLEHPEDGIHSGLLRKLIGLLGAYSDESQVILSSHSAEVLDTLTPQNIRLVTMHSGATCVREFAANELEAASSYLRQDGSLSEFVDAVAED